MGPLPVRFWLASPPLLLPPDPPPVQPASARPTRATPATTERRAAFISLLIELLVRARVRPPSPYPRSARRCKRLRQALASRFRHEPPTSRESHARVLLLSRRSGQGFGGRCGRQL